MLTPKNSWEDSPSLSCHRLTQPWSGQRVAGCLVRCGRSSSDRSANEAQGHGMSGSDSDDEEKVHRTVERVARESYGRLIAYLSVHTQTWQAPKMR